VLEVKHRKTLSAGYALVCFVAGVALFFTVLIWFLPSRAEIMSHFRLYLLPTIFFGFTGKLIHEKNSGNLEKLGKGILGLAAASAGALLGLFIYILINSK
jgi:hypothetical protein